VFSVPSSLFGPVGIRTSDKFVLITVYEGKRIIDVKAEKNEARSGSLLTMPLPKVQVRDNGKLTTRR